MDSVVVSDVAGYVGATVVADVVEVVVDVVDADVGGGVVAMVVGAGGLLDDGIMDRRASGAAVSLPEHAPTRTTASKIPLVRLTLIGAPYAPSSDVVSG